MHISNESLLAILVVGLIAGWLAGKFVQGAGFGLIGDIAIGIVGAFIGDWLLPQIGIHLGTGIVSAIVNATIGAVLLLLVVRLLQAAAVLDAGADADGGRPERAPDNGLPARSFPANIDQFAGGYLADVGRPGHIASLWQSDSFLKDVLELQDVPPTQMRWPP